MKRIITILSVLLMILLLVVIRFYEDDLFYDPLLNFFKTNHTTQPLPEMDRWKLLLNISYRYVLNTVLSLAILWIVFRDNGVIKISALLYLSMFIIFSVAFILLMHFSIEGEHLALFYVRRFLIQPLLLLILLPAFYFQQRK